MFDQLNTKIDLDILAKLKKLAGNNFVIDSRKVKLGDIFCACLGANLDGRSYIQEAIKNGAKCILLEEGLDLELEIEHYVIKNLAQYIGLLLGTPHNYAIVGITGTNGKTSTSYWLDQAYRLLGEKSAIIGTMGAGIYPNIINYNLTTPDVITLQSLLNNDFSLVDIVNMEVSSHALVQGRVNGVSFNTAIFTNLTEDHLDYHADMEEYFQAKKSLFNWHDLENAIINIDDNYGHRLYNELNWPTLRKISYGIDNGLIRATNIVTHTTGITFNLNYMALSQQIVLKIIGRFNIYNILALSAYLIVNNISLKQIAQILANLTQVRGRLNAINKSNRPQVIIDYAHTPDALKNALLTLQEFTIGKIYCVFGCGGNRDTHKRKLMAGVAQKYANYTIVTTDNPRNEIPSAIIDQIIIGFTNKNSFKVIENRLEAIKFAINNAEVDDIILLAGKGHETYQEINSERHYFSDFAIVDSLL